MHENLDRARIRKHLLTFAFSAPVTALLTFILLVANKGDAADEASISKDACIYLDYHVSKITNFAYQSLHRGAIFKLEHLKSGWGG